MLAAFLLASLAWGATAEFTHNHGFRSNRSLLAQTQSADSSVEACDSLQSSETTRKSSRSSSGPDCLICQLHQNLFSTTLGHTPETALDAAQLTFGQTPQISYPSRLDSQRHGRAPPSIL